MKKLLTVSIFLLSASMSFAGTVNIRNNEGGDPGAFYQQIKTFKKNGTKVIISGKCASSCALYLHKDAKIDVCVTKNAKIGFHSAFVPDKNGGLDKSETAKKIAGHINKIIYNGMPLQIQKKISHPSNWPSVYKGDSVKKVLWIKGNDLSGFPICEN